MTNSDLNLDEIAKTMSIALKKLIEALGSFNEEKIKEILKQSIKPTLSEAERVILENVDNKYKWIARDDWDNQLFIYTAKPIKNEIKGNWGAEGDNADLELFNHLFQFITWQDDEPYNIEELLKGE